VDAKIDYVMSIHHRASAFGVFDEIGQANMDKERVVLVPDHYVPARMSRAPTGKGNARGSQREWDKELF